MVRTGSPTVSSFGVIKGTMIPETYAAFRAWDWSHTKQENLDRIRESNLVRAANANWLRDVRFTLSARFDPEARDRSLVQLAQKDPGLDLWRPLLLWHMAQGEFLFNDFLLNWLPKQLHEGYTRFKPLDLLPHLAELAKPGGPVQKPWSESTSKHVAAALLKMAADFGLLEGSSNRTLGVFHLPEPCFLYALHYLLDHLKNPRRVVEAPDWQVFLLSPAAVHRELLRLHQYRKLEYHTAGSLVELQLPAPNLLAYVEGWRV